MFRGHIGQRATDISNGAGIVRFQVTSKVEIEQHRLAIGGDQYIGWFDVSMHNASSVCVRQPICQTRRDPSHGFDVAGLFENLASRLSRVLLLSELLSSDAREGPAEQPPPQRLNFHLSWIEARQSRRPPRL